MEYKGIELDGLDKEVRLAHSRFFDCDEGTDWIGRLFSCDKDALAPMQFHAVSALSSVINMDYQICNGGLEQYFFNGYHEYRKPFSDDDVAHLGKAEQCDMLVELGALAKEVFPDFAATRQELLLAQEELRWLDEDEEDRFEEVEELFFDLSWFVARLCEAYAQYLCKGYGIRFGVPFP